MHVANPVCGSIVFEAPMYWVGLTGAEETYSFTGRVF